MTGVFVRRGDEHTDMREDHVKTQRKDGPLRARERGLEGNQPYPHLDFPASRTLRK